MGFNNPAEDLGLCCGVVFVDQAADDLRSGDPLGWERDDVRAVQWRPQVQLVTLVRMSGVVVLRVLQGDPQMAVADDERPVGTFGAEGLHPAFGKGVHLRGLRCRLLDLDGLGGEDGVECIGEDGVSVPDQVSEPVGPLTDVGQEVPGQLGRPGRGGMLGNPEDVHAPGS